MTLRERIERLWCRWFGHDWTIDQRGEPVTTFAVCERCGKIGRRFA